MNTYNTPVIFFPSSLYFTVHAVFTSSDHCWFSYEQQNLRRRGSNLTQKSDRKFGSTKRKIFLSPAMNRRGLDFLFIIKRLGTVHISHEKRLLDSTCLSVRINEPWFWLDRLPSNLVFENFIKVYPLYVL